VHNPQLGLDLYAEPGVQKGRLLVLYILQGLWGFVSILRCWIEVLRKREYRQFVPEVAVLPDQ